MMNFIAWLMTLISMFGLYPKTCVVTDVNYVTDTVQIEDFNGEIWEFHGCEDWVEDDICSVIMYDNGTEIIYDDVILSVRYSGWFNGWEK